MIILNPVQNLIVQRGNFLIQTLLTEQSAQINALIVAKAKSAKNFKCTYEGTNHLQLKYLMNLKFEQDAIKTTQETSTCNLTFADRILEKGPKNVTGQVNKCCPHS